MPRDSLRARPRRARGLGPLHILIPVVCFHTAIVDGWDNQVIGCTAAAIAPDLGVPLSSFGVVFSAVLVGTLVGVVALGRLAAALRRGVWSRALYRSKGRPPGALEPFLAALNKSPAFQDVDVAMGGIRTLNAFVIGAI